MGPGKQLKMPTPNLLRMMGAGIFVAIIFLVKRSRNLSSKRSYYWL